MSDDMPKDSRFVTVDPSRPSRQVEKNYKTKGIICQTCFITFETYQELRDHIADYQASDDVPY